MPVILQHCTVSNGTQSDTRPGKEITVHISLIMACLSRRYWLISALYITSVLWWINLSFFEHWQIFTMLFFWSPVYLSFFRYTVWLPWNLVSLKNKIVLCRFLKKNDFKTGNCPPLYSETWRQSRFLYLYINLNHLLRSKSVLLICNRRSSSNEKNNKNKNK